MGAGRPKEFDNLTTTTINVESRVLEKAKRMFNVSEVCRNALAQAIDDVEIIKKHEKEKQLKNKFIGVPRKFVRKAENFIVQNPETAERWAQVVNQKFNKRITPEDMIDFISYR